MTRILAALGQHLLAPILSTLSSETERIILLPSAELFLFPLHAAILRDDASARICDKYTVSYAPSVEVLVNTQARTLQEGGTAKLYAYINPAAASGLTFTLIEEAIIAEFFEQQSIDRGKAGTKHQVREGIRGCTYVHFACHGSYDWNDPPASGLDLADSRLSLDELQRGGVDLSFARLVTLSACETGLIDVVQGVAEEYVGIPAGFLLAGVPCVVSSLWVAPDLSTALLMGRFYRNHLESKLDIAAALREAQVWVRELTVGEVVQYMRRWYQQSRGKEKSELFKYLRHYQYMAGQNPTWHPFAHPYYWAAFTCTGA
jgi:CHAT domain-containing protein